MQPDNLNHFRYSYFSRTLHEIPDNSWLDAIDMDGLAHLREQNPHAGRSFCRDWSSQIADDIPVRRLKLRVDSEQLDFSLSPA